jgi:methyltransferase
MRVLLVWPRNQRAVLSDQLSCCEPLPLEYLAGALRPDHDVRIHDLRLDGPLEADAERHEPPGLIGVAVPYTTNVRVAREATREAKRLWPDVPVVIGGHHPTVTSSWLDGFAADYVIAGEGGGPLRHLASELERGGSVAPVTGLAPYGIREGLARGGTPAASALNDLPLPDRSLLARNRDRYFHSVYKPVALARLSAGCPYTCNFCSLWRMTNRRYLVKDVDRVLTELTDIAQRNVYLVDDEAFIQPSRMLELADAIAAAGIDKRYHMYVRTDTALRRPEVITKWAEIGLDSVLVGAESMTSDELTGYGKGTRPKQTVEAIDLFHSLGVRVRANFIAQPTWDDADFDQLVRTIEHLDVDMPSFSVLTPLPGTDLYDDTADGFISDEPELFDCYHTLLPTRLPLERFYARMAGLLQMASARTGVGLNSDGQAAVFYHSDDDAFGQMLATVRRGHLDTPLKPGLTSALIDDQPVLPVLPVPPPPAPAGPEPVGARGGAGPVDVQIARRPPWQPPVSPEPVRRSS